MVNINIDFARITGKIKPMHAINNMPSVPQDFYGLYPKYTEAKIPYARLHDTGGGFGGSHYVDIENIFTDFSADVNDPLSYDFAFTDVLITNMIKAGVKPFYRLGCTIENYQYIKPYHIYPPADPYKWAQICEHIIAHYNEGWADGFEYGIEYWEIWNEPDNEPEVKNNPMWKGTPEQYFELYDITAKHLKKRFPDIKIGGYASCGFYAISNADFSETAHSTSRVEYFVEFFLDFLRYISAHDSPMDFFSWHSYAGIKENVMYAEYARNKLAEFGYGNVEVIFNEWNPGIANRSLACDAANIAAMMCAMQHTSTDMCMYYDGQVSSSYCGLFDPLKKGLFKAYYAFYAFGKLFTLGNEAYIESDNNSIYTLAACGSNGEKLLLAVNTGNDSIEINISGSNCSKAYITDDNSTWECKDGSNDFVLTPHSVVLFEL